MKEIMRELDKLSKANVQKLVQQKKEGTPLIEYNSTYIPEEIIRAAGANTYLMLRGGEPEPTDAVLDYMLRFMNPLARSMAGFLELGLDPITPNADEVVIAETDCHVARISELLEFKKVKVAKVGIPADWQKPVAFDYYKESLRRMVAGVEEITGKPVDVEAARKNFDYSNKINEVFRKIDDLCKKDNPPIKFEDYIRLHHLSFSVGNQEVVLDALNKIYDKLKDAPGVYPEGAPRILIAGRVVAIGDYTVARVFDEAGGAIVAHMLDEGVRVTEKDVEIEGDLIHNFTQNRYRDILPNDLFQPAWNIRFERMKELIETFKIDGVLWYQLAFDEIYDMEYSCIAKWLNEINVPLLKLETGYSYSREEMGPLTTRVESFVQKLKEGK